MVDRQQRLEGPRMGDKSKRDVAVGDFCVACPRLPVFLVVSQDGGDKLAYNCMRLSQAKVEIAGKFQQLQGLRPCHCSSRLLAAPELGLSALGLGPREWLPVRLNSCHCSSGNSLPSPMPRPVF
eukprot:g30148.t1